MKLAVSSAAGTRLEAAREWLTSLPRDCEALILAPHGHAATELVRAGVAEAGTRFGFQRFTVDRLASHLALPEMAERGAAPATSLSLAAVVTRAIHRLVESERVGRFAAIARRPGFPHAVVRTWHELRGAGLDGATLRSALGPDDGLAAIVERTERELAEMRLSDRAEIFRIARGRIERGEAFPGAAVLLLDLSLEHQDEVDLVSALMSRAPRGMATAAAGDARAVLALQEMLGISPTLLDGGSTPNSLAMLQRHLFEETSPAPRALDSSVALASWPGEARECVEIARRIQAEAEGGVRFDRMAVLLRSPASYRAHMEEALRRAAVPAHFARGTRRPDPAGRALLALLSCRSQDLSARRFAEYLSLSQVPDPADPPVEPWEPPDHDLAPTIQTDLFATATPATTAAPDTVRAPWRWERLLVDAAVIGGRDRWRRRLDGLVREIALRRRELAEEDARTAGLACVAGDLEQLRTFALPLIDLLDALPREATWSTWLEHLRHLAASAIRDPQGVLSVLAELDPLGPVGPVDLSMVQHVLAPRLRELTVPAERPTGGAVFVGPIELARGLTFDIVFVPGLAEKLFPPRIVEDPLLPDRIRARLAPGRLATQDTRVATERLALRLAVGAARRQIVLSWPRVDLEKARARVPSFYGLEAVRAATGTLPGFDELRSYAEEGGEARLGWPAPERPEQAIDDSEYDLAVLARLQREPDPRKSTGAARYLLDANPHLGRALRARGRRWLKRWTPADGLVDPDPEALAALERHRMGARPFSPTALEHFSACPYRFLLQAVHRLQPREEAEALETIDPLTRGALFHEIQFAVSTRLRDEGHLPLDPGHLETAFAILQETADRVADAHEERLAPAIPRVWMDGMNAIRADLREWLRRSAEGARGWVPDRFELSFGLADRDRPNADAASAQEPVRVLDNLLLRGSIDLVERRADGALRVTDHKTGKARVPAGAVVWGGAALQPVLYGLAAEVVLKAPVESGRLYYCTADGDFVERAIALDEENRQLARRAIDVIGRALEQGFLPAAPARDACRWCDYRTVCGPHEEARTARKPKDRLSDLLELRGLP
jgi:CRISPR/Cas system-associated exonuclease Cas4 (RecB family)